MRIPRKDNTLNDAIELLDEKFFQANSDIRQAWESLDTGELDWIDDQIEKCIFSRRYYLENYHTIIDEHGQAKATFPFLDQQEMIFEALEKGWEKDGCFRGIVLKPRQTGGTTFVGALVFHRTIFEPRVFSAIMAQNEATTAILWQRTQYAFVNLPWWMQPELGSKQAERHMLFQRKDERQRNFDPGLDSTLLVSNSQKEAGILIGRTVRCAHFSEVSRWPSADSWSADIEPSLNARDILAIMESTALGRNGLFYNMWNAAEEGESDWTPIFIPVHKVRKYRLPFKTVKEEKDFTLTEDEEALRLMVKEQDNFTIPLSFFNWRRRKIRATINATTSDELFPESYPSTPKEAFVSSGLCAFPRKCLNEQSLLARDPKLIGEIHFTSCDTPPIFSSALGAQLRPPDPKELLKQPTHFDRLWVWETPDENDAVEYYIGSDVSSGTKKDFSCAVVWKVGCGRDPDIQVASWHGMMDPSHYAKVLAALGVWYHLAEIAVEYLGFGITTGNDLARVLDYPNIYRYKHLDKITDNTTRWLHWQTNSKTRPEAINRMNQGLIDKTVILRDKFLIEEMRDFGSYEEMIKIAGIDNYDDRVMAAIIGLCALRERIALGGTWSEGSSGKAEENRPKAPAVYGIYDQFMRQVEQVATENEAKKLIAKLEEKHKIVLPWKIVPIQVMKANTPWCEATMGAGAERELYEQHGIDPKHQFPDMVQAYKTMLNIAHYEGGGAIQEDD